jgi:hypothetical protein
MALERIVSSRASLGGVLGVRNIYVSGSVFRSGSREEASGEADMMRFTAWRVAGHEVWRWSRVSMWWLHRGQEVELPVQDIRSPVVSAL